MERRDRQPATDQELRDALERAMAASMPDRRIHSVRRRPAAYRASFHLEEIDVVLDDGRTVPLMFKDVGALVGPSRDVKPPFLHHPQREIVVYNELLPPAGFRSPACYGALVCEADDRYWLFLERIAGPQLRECGEFERWQQAAAWLARLHSEFSPQAAALARRECLLRRDREYFTMWMARALATVTDPAAKDSLRGIASGYGGVVDRLESVAPTLIHGEFYPSNILARSDGGGIAPVDWEMAGTGPGVIDLAALVTGWPDGAALALIRTYFDAADRRLGIDSFEDLRFLVDCARLHLAIQWLGWSENWIVPAEHRHDWHRAALALAGRVMPLDDRPRPQRS